MSRSQRAGDLVVLISPPGLLDGVRDALQDWSAVGLVQPLCWLDDLAATRSGRPTVSLIIDGASTRTVLPTLMAEGEYARIRLCVLVPSFTDADVVDPDDEDRVAELVRVRGGGAAVTLVRLTITRPGSGPGRGVVARDGWHNLVLSPEDARGPGAAYDLLPPTNEPLEVGATVAAAVCSLAGRWTDMGEAPLDEARLPAEGHARVVRCFFRRLDAGALSEQIQRELLSTDEGLPRPRVGLSRAVEIEDVELATSTTAKALWAKHRDVLRSGRTPVPAASVTRLGVGAALRMFFSFLAAAIRNAPLAWYQRAVGRAQSAMAARVQQMVFGSAPSAYEVVVGGRRPDGSVADWQDVRQASGELVEVLGLSRGREQLAHADLGRVWRDYAAAALTLVDAGDRGAQDLRPISVGAERGVLAQAADSVPAPSDFFAAPATVVGDVMGTARVAPADVVGARAVRERLLAARQDPVVAVAVESTMADFDAWFGRYRRSFATQSGAILDRELTGLRSEIKQLMESLAQAAQAREPSEAFARAQRRLALFMRVAAVVAVLLLVGVGALTGTEVLTLGRGLGIAGAVVAVWLVSSLVAFFTGQQQLFAELNRREQAASAAEANSQNLAAAIGDLRRVADAYAQHVAWSRVLGVFLAQPYGGRRNLVADAALADDGLPLAMRLGTARPTREDVTTLVARLRRDFFTDGWLTGPFRLLIGDAPRRLGVGGLDLADDVERLYSARGTGDSELPRWAELLESEGVGAAAAQAAWAPVVATLRDQPGTAPLLEQVAPFGGAAVISHERFMTGVGEVRSGELGTFDQELFSPSALAGRDNAVATAWVRQARADLDEVVVRAEFSDPVSTFELVGLERRGDLPPPPPEDMVF